MNWFESLCSDYLSTANTVLLYAIIISVGVLLGKIKIRGISLGVTWVLFVGLFAGHLGLQVEPNTLHFIREFGLILFVFCIGLTVRVFQHHKSPFLSGIIFCVFFQISVDKAINFTVHYSFKLCCFIICPFIFY